jgi:hypothetical protein
MQIQKERVGSGEARNFEFTTWLCSGNYFHYTKITGPVGLRDRIELYKLILGLNASDTCYCILDNSGDHEIKKFFGVTVTIDFAYKTLVKLARTNATLHGLDTELYATNSLQEAEDLLCSQFG